MSTLVSSLHLKRFLVLAALIFTFACAAIAQDQSSKFDLAVGYAGVKEDISSNLDILGLGHPWANGWQASAAYNFTSHIGAEFQANAFYKGIHIPGNIPIISSFNLGNLNVYTYTVGPTVKLSTSRVQPYVHGLVGIAHASVGTSGILNFLPIPTSLDSFNSTHLAFDLGGGVDFMVVPHIGIRGEVGDLITRFPLSNVALTSNNTQNNFKVMAGVAIHF
jgi:opacity protein-like surface antigen